MILFVSAIDDVAVGLKEGFQGLLFAVHIFRKRRKKS